MNHIIQLLESRTLLSAGDTDPTFGANHSGRVAVPVANFHAYDIAAQRDGKILVGGFVGEFEHPTATVFRLNKDGSVDESFGGGDGVVSLKLSRSQTVLSQLELQPDGRIVAAGFAGFENPTDKDFVIRLKSDGSLDKSFSGDGVLDLPSVSGIALDHSNRIYVADGKFITRFKSSGAK